jgi:hypothetical protein
MMEKSNLFPHKLFLEQWLPRLVALTILAYLGYSLLFKQDHLSWLHIILLAMAIGLILAPMASRLRVANLIDFNSKLDGLKQEQQETRTQLKQLRNQISSTISMRSNPIQVVTFDGIRELLLADKQAITQLAGDSSTAKNAKYSKDAFLRTANRYCSIAFPLLMLTRTFQVTANEHRFYTAEMDFDENHTRSETIKDLVTSVLATDLTTLFPFQLIDEKNQQKHSVITPDVIQGLHSITTLADLYEKVQTGDEELPSPPDIDPLFKKVAYALATLTAALEVLASNSILYRHRLTSFVDNLGADIQTADPARKSPST